MRRGKQRSAAACPCPAPQRSGEGAAVRRMRYLPGHHRTRLTKRGWERAGLRSGLRPGLRPLPPAARPRGARPRSFPLARIAPPLRQDGAAGTESALEVERRLLDAFRAGAAAALPGDVKVPERRVIDVRGSGAKPSPAPSQPGRHRDRISAAIQPCVCGERSWVSLGWTAQRPWPLRSVCPGAASQARPAGRALPAAPMGRTCCASRLPGGRS